MTEQLEVALLLGGGLSAAGFVRVYVTNGSLVNALAISVSLLAIVTASVLLGTGLPFALARGGVDPAHAGTSIQVGALRVCNMHTHEVCVFGSIFRACASYCLCLMLRWRCLLTAPTAADAASSCCFCTLCVCPTYLSPYLPGVDGHPGCCHHLCDLSGSAGAVC